MGVAETALIKRIITVGKKTAPVLDPGERVEFFSTGSLLLDARIGGFPRRRITELAGLPNTGKTSLWMLGAKKIVESGGAVLCIDSERSFANEWATALGIDRSILDDNGVPAFMVVQPDNAEEALQIYLNALREDYHQMIVIDSIAKLNPASENELDMTKDARIGQMANMLTRITKVSGPLLRASQSKPAVIYVNQVRAKIQEDYTGYSNTPGGYAIKYDASIRLETLKPKDIMGESGAVLDRLTIRLRQTKNKVTPRNTLELYVHLDRDPETGEYSVNEPAEVYEVAAMYGIFEGKDGKKWEPGMAAFFKGQDIGRGQPAITERITTDYELFTQLRDAIHEHQSGRQADQRDPQPLPDAGDGGDVPESGAA